TGATPDRCPLPRRHQPRPRSSLTPGPLSLRPVLPRRRLVLDDSATARKVARDRAVGALLPRGGGTTTRPAGLAGAVERSAEPAQGLRLARERARAQKCDGARGHPLFRALHLRRALAA